LNDLVTNLDIAAAIRVRRHTPRLFRWIFSRVFETVRKRGEW
jgi:hypothetical protein